MDIDHSVQSLLDGTRVAVLATRGQDHPLASAIPFLAITDWTCLLIHISTLAAHTQNLLRDPSVSVLLMESDDPSKNPLALRRLILQGTARRLDSSGTDHATRVERFTARFPESRITMALADFQFWELQMVRAQFIAGFGQAFTKSGTVGSAWTHQGRAVKRET